MTDAPKLRPGPGSVKIKTSGSQSYELEVAYTLHAPGSGAINPYAPVLVLLHPFTTSQDYWKPQLDDPEFGGRYASLTFDFPGHALSPTHARSWSHWDMAQAVLAALDQVGIPRAIVIGVSQGGFTAFRVAMLDQKRAGIQVERKILGVVSAGSSIDPEAKNFVEQYSQTASSIALAARGEGGKSGSNDEALKMISSGMAEDQVETDADKSRIADWPAFTRSLITRSLSKAVAADPSKLGDQIETNFNALLTRDGIADRVKAGEVTCPVLVVHGSKDVAYPPEDGYHTRQVDALKEAGTRVDLEIVEGAPHFISLSAWREFDAAILKWIETLA